ncbi:uncharacterized protein CC84DRAFT_735891 [Paraphaeosphaeria sporulosa]|uniref:Uncharacterized protein n=1 Tax=Paraphaeosphaeria sporulosa TaxID=1460663 RepID=A0A177CF49_9PLEO|nr:uncharacterized protein CC84DRAFT_735891 [Paraphaeosphaeria sporulosa]OAG05831.1 hypothetical protein CC84DRAFT_735891 [Paraphaeosphaeria sporulosa]
MELHHRSCVLPSNAPALPNTDTYIPSRVLQERSANRRHGFSEDASSCKRSPTPIYAGRLGGYFTGNLASHFNGDKSEAQIDLETKRLMKLLKACDKYQKYRDRQPSDTASAKDNKEQRWPDHLEEAFFRGMLSRHSYRAQTDVLSSRSMATHGPPKANVGWPAAWPE